MNSGIYKLTFSDGRYYIGKTNNFSRRIGEHYDKLNKGTASQNMQIAYRDVGQPKFEILLECHEDHIHLMEPFYIAANAGPKMLNSVVPSTGTQAELDILVDNQFALQCSTATMCLALRQAQEENSKLEREINTLKYGTRVADLEAEVSRLDNLANKYFSEVQRLKGRSLFERIFNN